MSKIFKLIGITVLLMVFGTNAYTKEVQTLVTYPYKSFNSDTKAQALEKARMNAWKKYTSDFSVARKTSYRENKSEFMSQLNDLIVEEIIVQEKNDKENQIYKIAIRVNFDDNAVLALFNDLSSAGNQALGEASNFGSIFIARKKMTAKSFDNKRIDIQESSAEDSLIRNTSSDGSKSIDAASTKTFSKKATGGSTSRKRTTNTWELDDMAQEYLVGAINEHLVNAGFEPMDYNDLGDYGAPYIDEIYNETTDKGKLKGKTETKIKNAAYEAEWSYFGYGTVDLDLPITDDATGLFKVAATVKYKVLMFQNGKSRTVATVKATQVYGLAETEDFATNEALNKAAEKAITTVVDQLQKKGIR